MATQYSTLSWKIPWTEESGRVRYSPWVMGRKESDTTERLHLLPFLIRVAPDLGKISVISRRQRPLVAALGAYAEDPGSPWEIRCEVPTESRQGRNLARCSIN